MVIKAGLTILFLFAVLEAGNKVEFFLETVPYLVKVCQAFPPMFEDVTSLLLQLGRVCVSHLSCDSNILTEKTDSNLNFEPPKKKSKLSVLNSGQATKFEHLHIAVKRTFSDIVKKSIVTRNIYS